MLNILFNIIILLSISVFILNDDGVYLELPKYGEVEFEKQSWIYLNLEDFEKGDKILLGLIFTAITFFEEVPIILSETNNFKEINQVNRQRLVDYNCYQEIDGYTIDHSCNFQYELIGNFKYLIIITPNFQFDFYMIGKQIISHKRPYIIEYTIVGVLLFIILVILLLFIIYRIKKRKNMKVNNDMVTEQLQIVKY